MMSTGQFNHSSYMIFMDSDGKEQKYSTLRVIKWLYNSLIEPKIILSSKGFYMILYAYEERFATQGCLKAIEISLEILANQNNFENCSVWSRKSTTIKQNISLVTVDISCSIGLKNSGTKNGTSDRLAQFSILCFHDFLYWKSL